MFNIIKQVNQPPLELPCQLMAVLPQSEIRECKIGNQAHAYVTVALAVFVLRDFDCNACRLEGYIAGG